MPQWVYKPGSEPSTPKRRRLSALAEGLGGGLQQLGQFGLQRSLIREQAGARASAARQESLMALVKDFGDKVTKGDLDPEQAANATGLPVGYFANLAPSAGRVSAGLMEAIHKAPSLEQTPSESAILGSVPKSMKRVKLGAVDSPSQMDEATGVPTLASTQMQPVSASPDLDAIIKAASQKRSSFTTPVDSVDAGGVKRRTFEREQGLQGKSFATEPTPEQKAGLTSRELGAENTMGLPTVRGRMAGTEAREKALAGDLSPEVTNRKIDVENKTEAGTRAGKAASAYATGRAGAQAAFDVKTNAGNVAKQRAIDGGLPPHVQQASFQLAGDFAQQSKDFYTSQTEYRKLAELSKRASAAGDLGIIFSYMKILDPGSTVREGEQAQAATAGSIPERVWAQYNRMLTGERLDPRMRADFVQRAGDLFRASATEHQSRVADFTQRAQRYGVPPDLVVRNPALDLMQQSSTTNPLDIVRSRGRGQGRGQRP